MKNLFSKATALAAALMTLGFVSAPQALAGEFGAYTPARHSGSVSFNYINQYATELWKGSNLARVRFPYELDTLALSASYGITDKLAIEGQIGYSEVTFARNAVDPDGTREGFQDSVIGFRYRVLDETEGSPVTASVGVKGIIAGSYEASNVNSLGAGASGASLGVSVGRNFLNGITLTGEVGGRLRFDRVPEQIFTSGEVSYSFLNRATAWFGLAYTNSLGGKVLGSPGFTPADFPRVEEDHATWHGGMEIRVAKGFSLSGAYGQKFEGRNTTKDRYFRVGLSYAFH